MTQGKPPEPGDESPTVTSPVGAGQRPAAPVNRPPASEQSRAAPSSYSHVFRAGDLINNRYRIVAALGKGGMGEVFRADDLELGASVALKFLPLELSADPVRLEHFRSEVRLTRRISHPGVCRVYDIGQVDSPAGPRQFLSMEFIDGEDLSSLLRRIGRLPHDKAVEIARQICFGLAAAHEFGVVHRDLKPANIMIDGRGRARVTDFGVAGFADDLNAKGDIAAGTPQYMAPEQLEGREITKRSDVYSLGLVLFELFTGKPAFKASTFAELREQRAGGVPTSRPSTIVPDLDPAVERVILRCLETDPVHRPSSAIAVAAALPGGDPLAAALAAGETPSPELVAASGGNAVLTSRNAIIAAAVIVASLAIVVFATRSVSLLAQIRPAKSAEVLTDRAQDILKQLGLNLPAAHTVSRLGTRPYGWLTKANIATFPGRFGFWYRQSPAPFNPAGSQTDVTDFDPFPISIAEAIVRTDDRGTLEGLIVIPPSRVDSTLPARDADSSFKALFTLAGLDQSAFTSTAPTRRPPYQTDILRAWTGPDSYRPGETMTVHAGITDGLPTYFNIRYAFSKDPLGWSEISPREQSSGTRAGVVVILTASMGVLAYRNIRVGRGDKRAATVGAAAVLACSVTDIALRADVLPDIAALFFDGRGFAPALWVAALFWVFYIALEPAARRLYPHTLITWSRLIRGQIKDSLVARDILFAMLSATAMRAGLSLVQVAHATHVDNPNPPGTPAYTAHYLQGFAGIASSIASGCLSALMNSTGSMLLLVVGRLVFRSNIGAVIFCILFLAMFLMQSLVNDTFYGILDLTVVSVLVAIIRYRGLLPGVVYAITMFLSGLLLIGPDWTGIAAAAVLPAAILAALCLWAIRCATKPAPAA